MQLGRPSSYKPEYCDFLIKHMAKGYSFESFAATIDVSRAVLYLWATEDMHPDFLDAKKIGFDKRLLWLESQMILMITGESKGNPVPLIFKAKSAERELYGDKQTINHKVESAPLAECLSPQTRELIARELSAKSE